MTKPEFRLLCPVEFDLMEAVGETPKRDDDDSVACGNAVELELVDDGSVC